MKDKRQMIIAEVLYELGLDLDLVSKISDLDIEQIKDNINNKQLKCKKGTK